MDQLDPGFFLPQYCLSGILDKLNWFINIAVIYNVSTAATQLYMGKYLIFLTVIKT